MREYSNVVGGFPPGLGAPYLDKDLYSVLPLTRLTNQKTYENIFLNQTEFSGDYIPVATVTLEFFIYQELDGQFFIGVMDDPVFIPKPPGEGAPEYDNGVRMDIAFKADLSLLQGNKTNWLLELDDNSSAYDTKHPAGF